MDYMVATAEELRSKGVKEIFPGVFEFPVINTPENLRKYREFEASYGRQIEELYKKRRIEEVKADREFWREHPHFFV